MPLSQAYGYAFWSAGRVRQVCPVGRVSGASAFSLAHAHPLRVFFPFPPFFCFFESRVRVCA